MFFAWNEYRKQLLTVWSNERDYGTRFYLWLTVESRFEIDGIDFQTRRSNDCVFGSTTKIDGAIRSYFSNVTGVNPTLFIGKCLTVAIPVTLRDVVSTHEDLTL